MTEKDNDIGFIIRFIGDKCVGKTNLINLLVGVDFEEEYFSTSMPCYTRSYSLIDNHKIYLYLWDNPGDKRLIPILRE